MTATDSRRKAGRAQPYREWACRDPDGKILGRACPRLAQKGHGGWHARYEAPRGAGGRRRPRLDPFPTKREAFEALAEAIGTARRGGHVEDRRTTLGQYLARRLIWWGGLKPSTLSSYREAIERYYVPGLGHVRLIDLRPEHFRDLYAAIRRINKPGENPAAAVRLRGKRGQRRQRSLLWIRPRVMRLRETGEIPAAVMVWPAAQCGALLDSLDASQAPPRPVERLYALFHLAAYSGMRRSELAGLALSEVDLERARVHVRQAQVDDQLDSPKSEESDRQVPVDPGTVALADAASAAIAAYIPRRTRSEP
ncbi:MAG: hypothetical protein J2P28_01100 [Actinobacteria bacterium]|nr:hypothetical protein [Actinomycetota bacterium]